MFRLETPTKIEYYADINLLGDALGHHILGEDGREKIAKIVNWAANSYPGESHYFHFGFPTGSIYITNESDDKENE